MMAIKDSRISASMASSAVVLIAVSFMPRLRTACRTIVLNCSSRLFRYQSGPKFLIRETESETCRTTIAWKLIGTPSEVIVAGGAGAGGGGGGGAAAPGGRAAA